MAGYIGSSAAVSTSGTERKKTFAITTSTTSLTGLVYTVNFVHVYHNGIRLVDGTDFTATNGTSITLVNAAENGDEVVVVSYATFSPADSVPSTGGTFSGDVTVTKAGTPIIVDRTGSNGTILDLKKDGSSVGGLGTGLSGGSEFGIKSNTGELQLATSYNSNTVTWDGSQLYPSATSNLGASSARWQDLYLSGGVYLGGTGSANYLQDYEAGTWTPTIASGTITVNEGASYTKVGRNVILRIGSFSISDATSGSTIDIGGLPFASSGSSSVGSVMSSSRDNNDAVQCFIPATVSSVRFYRNSSTGGYVTMKHNMFNSPSNNTYITITYQTA